MIKQSKNFIETNSVWMASRNSFKMHITGQLFLFYVEKWNKTLDYGLAHQNNLKTPHCEGKVVFDYQIFR